MADAGRKGRRLAKGERPPAQESAAGSADPSACSEFESCQPRRIVVKQPEVYGSAPPRGQIACGMPKQKVVGTCGPSGGTDVADVISSRAAVRKEKHFRQNDLPTPRLVKMSLVRCGC